MAAGPSDETLAARLDALESRAAITDLVHRYALNVRRGRGGDNAALFVEDGAFETRRGDLSDAGVVTRRLEGRDAIRACLAAQAVALVPLVHNAIVELDGDTATGTAMLVSLVPGTSRQVLAEYRDAYRRTADGWRFVERVAIVFADGSPAPAR